MSATQLHIAYRRSSVLMQYRDEVEVVKPLLLEPNWIEKILVNVV